MEELSKTYNPKATEDKIYSLWEKADAFQPKVDPKQKPFTIVIPPPNVTGSLHMGHALNNTIQDILIRRSRMKGVPTLWVPGTDHAGIATQNVVEKKLAKEGPPATPERSDGGRGKSRQDLGREEFVKEVWHWVDEYGHIIIDQLKKLGCSCDWSRQRFTMDEDYSKAVNAAFEYYYNKGWIYQGERVINWCVRCQTALSDIEVEHKEVEGKLYYIKYPVKNSVIPSKVEESPAHAGMANKLPDSSPSAQNDNYITVATTRPETMLGDTAVAIHPDDKRYKNLVGKKVKLPLTNREIPIIADSSIDPKFGTGAVKVTPAHDMNDFEIGGRHNLEKLKVIDETGKLTPLGCSFQGQKALEARENIVKELQEMGLIEKIEDYAHPVPHCYRCGRVVEQLLSKQWFLKMKELAKPAIEAVKSGEIKFVPERWSKVYLNWMENLRDWCISRQIWWGHKLPVFIKQEEKTSHFEAAVAAEESPANAGLKQVERSFADVQDDKDTQDDIYIGNNPPDGYKQVDDVLDTWFSSALWPFAVFLKRHPESIEGSPANAGLKQVERSFADVQDDKLKNAKNIFGQDLVTDDLAFFYPTTVLTTGRDIIYLWVARMIFSGYEFMHEKPFSTVYIHPTIFNIEGKRMSKSLGTGIDPLELIQKYGADATRFGLAYINTGVQDIKFDENAILAGQKFANKIWNISRFVLLQIGNSKHEIRSTKQIPNHNDKNSKPEPTTDADKQIIQSLNHLITAVNSDLDNFRFGQAAHNLYDFVWHDLADIYLEKSKAQNQNDKLDENTAIILLYVLTTSLKLLHPFMPFLTEEIWQTLKEQSLVVEAMLVLAEWPKNVKTESLNVKIAGKNLKE